MSTPPIIYRTKVIEEWIDYNNHMTEHAYSLVFGKAVDAFVSDHGIGREYCEETGCTVYTLASQLHFIREVRVDTDLEIDLLMLDVAEDVIHVFQSMFDNARQLKATYEAIIGHVNQRPCPKVAAFPAKAQSEFGDLYRHHKTFSWPLRAGAGIRIRRGH